MQINADLALNVALNSNDLSWIDSPAVGVQRKMLERDGEEVARATSLVKYEAGVSFPEHKHDLGEEFFVLEGTFSDENGDYTQGTYVRNPPGSKHSPFSVAGCVILVKLRQMDLTDQAEVRISTQGTDWSKLENFDFLDLYSFGLEKASMFKTHGKAIPWELEDIGGLELFVIEGAVTWEGRTYEKGSWLRLAAQNFIDITIMPFSLIWTKTGHLA